MVQKYIEKTKTEAGTRVLPMSDDVYEAFKRVISGREKPKVEEMIDGYTGFLFLDNRGKPMMPYQWEKKFQHSVAKYNKIYRLQLPKITPHVCRHTYCTIFNELLFALLITHFFRNFSVHNLL